MEMYEAVNMLSALFSQSKCAATVMMWPEECHLGHLGSVWVEVLFSLSSHHTCTSGLLQEWQANTACQNCYQGSRIKEQGSRIKDQGSRIKDQGSRNKDQRSRVEDQGTRTIVVNTFTTWSGYRCIWADSPERRYHLVTPWLLFVTRIGSDLSLSSDRICPRAEIVFVSCLLQYLVALLPPQLTKQLQPINFSFSWEATSWWRNHGAWNWTRTKQIRLQSVKTFRAASTKISPSSWWEGWLINLHCTLYNFSMD